MKKGNSKLLFELIHDYFMIYLPTQKCASAHTIRSYRMVWNQFLDYICGALNIKLKDIAFDDINYSVLSGYVDWLSTEKKCENSTCNHHLSAIKSFYLYASGIEPLTVKYLHELQNVPEKKLLKSNTVEYMSEKAVKAILQQPNTNTKQGIRDLFIMVLMYDTGARVGELIQMKANDIHIENTPYASLLGKGNKTRTVPLMSSTVKHFNRYMEVFHADEQHLSNEYLFYSTTHDTRNHITDAAIRKIIKKHANAARDICSEVPSDMYPHLWRHSRAMHLYQHGMDLTLISQWLGHSSIETTLIYAHADTEMKRKAIEKANGNAVFNSIKSNNSRFVVSDEERLKKLYGLR